MRRINLENYLTTDTEAPVTHNGQVFLGGTCNGSEWRDQMTPLIHTACFNPVVDNWTMETQQIEEAVKREAALSLYVITPKQTGFYSFAELMVSSIRHPERTVVAIIDSDGDAGWDEATVKSLDAIKALLQTETGITVQDSIVDAADAVNDKLAALGVVPDEAVDSIRNRE